MVSTAQGSAGSSCRFSTSLLARFSSSSVLFLFLFLFLYLYFYFLLNNTQRDYLAGLVNKNKGIMLNIIVGLSFLRPLPISIRVWTKLTINCNAAMPRSNFK